MRHSLLVSLVAVALGGCSLYDATEENVVSGVDFDELFAPPTVSEIDAVLSDWAGRDVSARGVQLVAEDDVRAESWSADVRVFSHEVGAATHYGAVLVPSAEPERVRPVLVYLHGGDGGVSVDDEVATLLAFASEIRDEFIFVVPSFRSEPLHFRDELYFSDGPPSPWDHDVDDALALVNVALATTPVADSDRIVVLGASRGAAVGLLMSARDPRIDGVVEFYGPSDFLGEFVQDVVRDALNGHVRNLPGLNYLNATYVQPLKNGDLSIGDVRVEMIRRSAVYFADRLPAVQIHHGLSDPIVPPGEAEALFTALTTMSSAPYEYYLYPGGSHHPFTLSGSLERAEDFLLRRASAVLL